MPDSITHALGLPPHAPDPARLRFADTLVVTQVLSYPSYARTDNRSQVGISVATVDTIETPAIPKNLALADCPIVLRVFRTSDRNAAPAWRSDKAPGSLSCPTPNPLHNSYAIELWDVAAILGDSLPVGNYTLGYAVRTADGRMFEFANGAARLDPSMAPISLDRSALRYSAHVGVSGYAPTRMVMTFTITNGGAVPVQLQYGGCPIRERLYTGSSSVGAPVWRSERSREGYVCTAVLIRNVLAPGDSATFSNVYPVYEILGDSLSGRYFASAEFDLLDGNSTTTVKADAGVVDLPRQREILPSTRVVDGVSYSATTRIVPGFGKGDTLRTLVLVTNTTGQPVTALTTPTCQVIVYAYRSQALRDSVPIQQAALTFSPSPCLFQPYRFQLAPGESWVFGNDVLVSRVRALGGPGHYWFTAWDFGADGILLSAGDVEVP